jgi:3-hydroxyisobutyrate dehydrogenase-like beta-hydroxyacid dehydrogenase
MGLPMARHLLRAGFDVSGYDRDPERLAALAEGGGGSAGSLSELARGADAVLLMVADDAQVREAALSSDGILSAARPGTVLIISSTVKPSTCREVADAAGARGVQVLDAPVALGQRAAEAGRLTVYVGGPAEVFERCRPVFSAFGREVVHLGEEVGAGQVAKLANNLILWAGIVAAHEALTFGARLGVPPRQLRLALQEGSADSHALRELHLHTLSWPQKDLAQAMEVAGEIGVTLPLAGRVAELMQALTREDLQRLT